MAREPTSNASLGVVAALGLVACCALPGLIAGGVVASLGAWLAQPLVIAVGVALVAAGIALAVRHHVVQKRSRAEADR